MTRILLRSPKSPFESVSPEVMLRDDLISSNSGNLIFLESAWKILDTTGTEIVPDRSAPHDLGADRINDEFDAYVIPLANAFRRTFEDSLVRLTGVLEKLTIPVIVVGVGLQARLPYQVGVKRPIDEAVSRFVRAVLANSASIGVRGEYTADYLRRLGFAEVEVIGCPSMFVNGDRIDVTKRTPALTHESRVGINITARIAEMGPVITSHVARYPNLEYIAQDRDSLRLLLWGDEPEGASPSSPMPIHRSHPLIRDDKTRFYVDPWPWLDDVRRMDFMFGTRIHGNIVALLAGTPSYVIAHDTRTLELARYFEIPHRTTAEIAPDTDAADLYAEADYAGVMTGHAARFATFTDYLERQGLRHVFQPGEDPTAFDRRIAAIDFPAGVGRRRLDTRQRVGHQVRELCRRVTDAAGRRVGQA